MVTLLATVFVFGLLVFVHELGHFIAAKRLGMRVDEFAIGFGPVIYQQREGETLYSLRLIPLGGFNKIYGMSEDEADELPFEGGAGPGTRTPEDVKRAFHNQPVWARMIVIAAGSTMNFLLPIVIFFGVLLSTGYDNPMEQPVIGKVLDKSPAMSAGIVAGDRIITINDKPIERWTDLINAMRSKFEQPVVMIVENQGAQRTVNIVPNYNEKEERSLIGITQATEHIKPGVLEAGKLSVQTSYRIGKGMVESLVQMVTGKAKAEVSGPLGVAQMAGSVAQTGISNLLTFAAFLSINLGIINMLPIPVLDGGHLLDLLIEAVRGKPLSGKLRYAAQMVGFAILMGIMIVATVGDIGRLLGQ